MRKKIAIVGNGPISKDYADFIDKHDFVIRFNACSNFGAAGRKVSAIVLANTGAPGRRFAMRADAIHADARRAVKQIWFARHPDLVETERAKYHEASASWIDHSTTIMHVHLFDKTCAFLPPWTWRRSMDKLIPFGAAQDAEPSTGMLAIQLIDRWWTRRLGLCHVNIFGFTHEGWPGHPWDAERRLIDSTHWIRRQV